MNWIIYFALSVIMILLPFTAISVLSDKDETLFLDRNVSSIAKGIAILCVMFCHFMGDFGGGTVLFTPLGGIGVAIFLILSGYGLNESWTRGGYSFWWRKRILAVIVPYALVEIICYWSFHEFSVIEFVLDIFCIKSKYHNGWYLQYLVLWYVIFYVVMRVLDYIHIVDGEKKILVFFLISVILFLTLSEIRAEQSLSFLTGIILSEKKKIIEKKIKWRNGILLILCGIAFLALKQLDFIRSAPQLVYNFVQLGIKWPVGMGLIILCCLVSEKINLKMFAWVGAISYELYLIHGYILPNVEGMVGAVLFWILSFGIGVCYHFIVKNMSRGLRILLRMEK